MVSLSLDDTLYAVVQVTHEHGLPLRGADVHPGRVQAFVDAADHPRWVRWLADPDALGARFTVWVKGEEVAFHGLGRREGIEWCVTAGVPGVLASPVLAAHAVTVDEQHLRVSAGVALALADVYALAGLADSCGRAA